MVIQIASSMTEFWFQQRSKRISSTGMV